jgi:anti-sigma regulatory factor (Ser/Thr protein kinase)
LIIDTDKNKVTSSETYEEHEFGIREEDQGFILNVLRSKMYSNPIKVICQEIACNARDANREVGKSKTPIRLGITIAAHTQGYNFSVEDDGPGISPERISNIFVNYGASTKRGTNKQTGGFGLGCKTPFSYTDTFSIITKHEGIKYTYQAAVGENNSGSLLLLYKEPTTENNGTSIIIPIKKKDVGEFGEACRRATLFWKIKPEFINIQTSTPYKHLYSDDTVIITAQEFLLSSGYYALIDDIMYEIDFKILPNWKELRNSCILFIFKNGVLSVSATRESLFYDQKTLGILKKCHETLTAKNCSFINDKIKVAPTVESAQLMAAYWLRQPYNEYIRDKNFFWEYEGTKRTLQPPYITENISVYKIDKYQKDKQVRVPTDILDTPCYVTKANRRNSQRDRAILKENPHFYLLKPKEMGTDSELDTKTKKQLDA